MNRVKEFWDYLFSPINGENAIQNQLNMVNLLIQTPLHTAKYFKFEISLALLYNVVISYIAKIYIYGNIIEYLYCQVLSTLFLIVLSSLNFMSIFPKIIIICKVQDILVKSRDQQELKDKLKNFLISKIYCFNQTISKFLLFAYFFGVLMVLYNWIFSSTCIDQTSIRSLTFWTVAGFIVRIVVSIIRSIIQQQKGWGINKQKLQQMKSLTLTEENIQCFREKFIQQNKQASNSTDSTNNLSEQLDENNEEICAICIDGYLVGQTVKYMQCEAQHFFHDSCIDKWLGMENKCPLCNGIANKQM